MRMPADDDMASASPLASSVPGLTVRSLVVALGFTLLTGVWVRQAEIVVLATQVTESVPAIPGLAVLVLLLPVNALLRRIRGAKPFSRAELLTIFLFVTIASMVMGIGVVQFLLALIGTPFYKQPAEFAVLQPHFPTWLFPRDPALLRQLYERAPDGHVPWELWLGPGLAWLGFFLVLAATLHCLMALFFRAWTGDERLAFPLVALPLEMTDETGGFWRNRVMWLGFGVAAAYNGVNILHAFYPSFPAIGKEENVGQFLTDLPWSAAQPFSLHFRPELIGLGYLVSTEISLTVWLGYALNKIVALVAAGRGYEPRSLYPLEQGLGAYLALAGVLAWMARRRLGDAWRGTDRAARRLLVGFFAGVAALWAFMTLAGVAGRVSLAYLLVVLAVALVYGRVRAQTGVPMVWLFPYHLQKQAFIYTFGSQPFLTLGGPSTLVTWTLFAVVAKGYFPTISGYQTEGMEIARRERIRPQHVTIAVFLAVAVGFALGWYHHLAPYYKFGALHLRGDIWGYWAADYEAQTTVQYLHGPVPPDANRVWATGAGALVVFALSLLRTRFAGFPLHPLGYAMSACFGDVLWFPFLVVWLLKTLALRYGGMRFYKQTVPFFLGLALGHFAIAGIFWGLVGAVSGEAVRGYEVFFG